MQSNTMSANLYMKAFNDFFERFCFLRVIYLNVFILLSVVVTAWLSPYDLNIQIRYFEFISDILVVNLIGVDHSDLALVYNYCILFCLMYCILLAFFNIEYILYSQICRLTKLPPGHYFTLTNDILSTFQIILFFFETRKRL